MQEFRLSDITHYPVQTCEVTVAEMYACSQELVASQLLMSELKPAIIGRKMLTTFD